MEEARAVARSNGWLAEIPEQDREEILNSCELLHFTSDEAIYNSGDEPGGLFGIVSGSLRIWLLSPNGEDGLAHIGGVGMWVGDAASVSGKERRITLSAASECALLRLSRSRLHSLAAGKPQIWAHVARLLAFNLLLAMDIIDALRRESKLERVAATLLNLAAHTSSTTVMIKATQTDVSTIAGLSRSTTHQALQELARREIVKMSYGAIVILDLVSLSLFVRGK